MSVEELLRQGREYEAEGNLSGAEQSYREAHERGDADAAMYLGLLLQRRGENRGAIDAFLRAEARGHPEAGSSLGNLLSDNGDIEGAKAAYERSIAAGSTDAVLNLGLALAQAGAFDEALPHLRVADERGDATASWAIGKVLEDRDDLVGAAAAYRRGAEAGNAEAAYGLGSALEKSGDREGARAAFRQAQALGHEGARHILDLIDTEQVGHVPDESATRWCQQYVAACGEALAAANVCLEHANRAVGARNMAAKRPQAEASIQSFTTLAEAEEQQFASTYRTFAEACTAARDAAQQFLATQSDRHEADRFLASSVDEAVLENVATTGVLLGASLGPTPAAFLRGIDEANAFMEDPSHTFVVYSPGGEAEPEERPCPACAKTIKSADVFCRYCGAAAQAQPNVR